MIVVQVEEVVNQTNVTAQTTEVKVFVRTGDEELSRQFALASQASAIAAGESETNAGASEQVATQKAAQTVEDAASALASKVDAESAATASGLSATVSNAAKELSEAAKVIAIEEAGQSSTSAGQSAASAAAALASSALITNKAQVNITTAGNILRADGTLFKSISEVEFLRNINAYRRAPDSKFFDNKQLIAWDNFDRPDVAPVIESDSGHPYSIFKTNIIGQVLNKSFGGGDSGQFETSARITIVPTKNIGLEFSFQRNTLSNSFAGIAIIKDNLNYFLFARPANNNGLFTEVSFSQNYRLIVVINGVSTVLAEIIQNDLYQFLTNDGFSNSRISFVIKYANRGRNDASVITVQSLDKPSLRIEVSVTAYNSTFVTPTDYNRIAVIANTLNKIYAYKVANLDL